MNYVVDKSVAHGAFLALKIGYILYRLKESRIYTRLHFLVTQRASE